MVAPGGCHVWTGARTSAGYPEFTVGGVTSYAHRWAYEHAVGPVPDGYDVHHICRNHACVNVDHLEALTRRAHAALHRKARA